MSKLHRLRTALVTVAFAVVVAASGAAVAHHEGVFLAGGQTVYSGVQAAASVAAPNTNGIGNNGGGNGHNTFTISGTPVDGLFPGAGYPVGSTTHPVYVYLTVYNPNNQAIRVTSLTYTVGNASSACTKANLAPLTETVSFSVVVPKNSQLGGTAFPLPVSMVPTADNACQDAHFPLALSGTAVGPA